MYLWRRTKGLGKLPICDIKFCYFNSHLLSCETIFCFWTGTSHIDFMYAFNIYLRKMLSLSHPQGFLLIFCTNLVMEKFSLGLPKGHYKISSFVTNKLCYQTSSYAFCCLIVRILIKINLVTETHWHCNS